MPIFLFYQMDYVRVWNKITIIIINTAPMN